MCLRGASNSALIARRRSTCVVCKRHATRRRQGASSRGASSSRARHRTHSKAYNDERSRVIACTHSSSSNTIWLQSGTPHRQQAAAVKQCVWTTSASRGVQGAAKMAAALLKEGSGVLGGGFSRFDRTNVSGILAVSIPATWTAPTVHPWVWGWAGGSNQQFQKTKLEPARIWCVCTGLRYIGA